MYTAKKGLHTSCTKLLAKTFMLCLLFVMVAIPSKAATMTVKENANFNKIGIVDVSGGNLNIRSKANTTASKVGTIVNHGVVTIKKTVDGEGGKWYYLTSGSVTGYAKAAYFETGSKALALAKKYGTATYTVSVDVLKLRKTASTSSSTLAKLSEGTAVTVLKSGIKADGYTWSQVKCTVSGKSYTGYVASNYLAKAYSLKTADPVGGDKKESEKKEPEKKTTEKEPAKESSSNSDAAIKKGASIAETAKKYVGKLRYVYGGTSLTKGTDCSGFTQAIYKLHGKSIPRTSSSQASSGKSISSSQLKPGDLVFYGSGSRINHVAIYVGNGYIVHNTNPKRGVQMDKMNYTKPCKYATYR